MRQTTPLAAAAVAVFALATACGSLEPASGRHEEPAGSAGSSALPVDRFQLSETDEETVDRARWALARSCMVDLGFPELRTLSLDPPPAWPMPPQQAGRLVAISVITDTDRYGVSDPEQAAVHGYQGAYLEWKANRKTVDRKWTLPQYVALTGEFVYLRNKNTVHGHTVPPHGCLGQADRTLYGFRPQDRRDPVLYVKGAGITEGEKTNEWKAADRAWSACMKAHGYHYAKPSEARNDPKREEKEFEQNPHRDPHVPSGLEKATAVADAVCKEKTHYVPTVRAIDIRVQKRLIQKNRTALEEAHRQSKAAADKARAILRKLS
ncbi:hypothetical protein FB563_7050 [Streptomyces puniciscabiei]|uniref:Lipoprotein n=1 Tax=Streptomyces puniciscabiei TaxID=164348 RepID=A0A542TJB2_9ACTN|nr:hypothetical protein [Streptomyces puniciscabiei]TQK86892.1 hypothetical protein FB563_7050 [Streptomyces puniciscabiei]